MGTLARVNRVLGGCTFETERLLVAEWRSRELGGRSPDELAAVVVSLLTERVTAPLPPDWQGVYTAERARGWIEERDAEGTTLLVVRKSDGEAVGLVMLFEAPSTEDEGASDVRLGYLLAEAVWGQGVASELVEGLVGWCRGEEGLATITGGVALDNPASARLLEKNGFSEIENERGHGDGERLYRRDLA